MNDITGESEIEMEKQSVTVAVFEALAHHGKYEPGDIGCRDIK